MGEPVATTSEPVGASSAGARAASASAVKVNSSLENLQSDEQRRVLDAVSQIRNCGLDSILSLPQIVVCGDQSVGKSSVLEAISQIPFPRNNKLCTRYATEIRLRQEPADSLTIRVIPDDSRCSEEKGKIKAFSETITDFAELPELMKKVEAVMGISEHARAFATDTLSIEVCGPDRPQLTLVDIPGLIHSSTKGVSEEEVAMVRTITDRYIEQPRTICLAVISAINDAANQGIIQRIRKIDPEGKRTLGVITKLDQVKAVSGSEQDFLALARNEDVFFKLGWHCLKNRAHSESDFSFEERNQSEYEFFATSVFSALPKDNVGIDALRIRLSHLLFKHVKKELPRLYQDLQSALEENRSHLKAIGDARSTASERRTFLGKLNMELYEISKAALSGSYKHSYFKEGTNAIFSLESSHSIARLRAAIQQANVEFEQSFRLYAHKFTIDLTSGEDGAGESNIDHFLFPSQKAEPQKETPDTLQAPTTLNKQKAFQWAQNALLRSRGTELVGNFNPSLVSELFWEQSEKWDKAASLHLEKISRLCHRFLRDLLKRIAPADANKRMWSMVVSKALDTRLEQAKIELKHLMEDREADPINYNHYYTDTIHRNRADRMVRTLRDGFAGRMTDWNSNANPRSKDTVNQMIHSVIQDWSMPSKAEADMGNFSCENALDSLLAIYKVQRKVFVANIVTQVVERRMVRGLESVFSPRVALEMPDGQVTALLNESPNIKRERIFREDRIRKLEEGQRIFREVLSYQDD